MDNSLKSQIDSAKEILILLSASPTFDEVAAGLGLYLSLSKIKPVYVSSFTPITVEFNRLVGVNKIKSELGSRNLTIRLVDYPAKNIEKVSYDIVDDEFRLLVIPKDNITPPGDDQVHLSYSGVSADMVILVGGTKDSDFPAVLADDLAKATKIHIGTSALNADTALGVLSFARPGSSVSELIASFIKESGLEADQDIATNLFAGVQKATTNLTSQEVTADTLELAAYLMRSGAKRELPEVESRQSFPFPQGINPMQFSGLRKARDITDVEEAPKQEAGAPQDWIKPPKVYRGGGDTSIS
jgi:hypothetical protein